MFYMLLMLMFLGTSYTYTMNQFFVYNIIVRTKGHIEKVTDRNTIRYQQNIKINNQKGEVEVTHNLLTQNTVAVIKNIPLNFSQAKSMELFQILETGYNKQQEAKRTNQKK